MTLSTTATTACGTTPSSCTAQVEVVDETPPTITCPSAVTAECKPDQPKLVNEDGEIEEDDLDLPLGTLASFGSPTAGTDNCGPVWLNGCDRPQSDWFPFGTNSVSCSARDQALPFPNAGECSFSVAVVDTTNPTISCPAAISTECTGSRSATVTPGAATGSDICAPLSSLTTHNTGSFPRGTTSLTYTAIDHVSLQASCSSTVTVVDTKPPTISCPVTKTAECTGSSSALVTPDPATATDVCAGVTIDQADPATFPMGSSTIGYSVKDEVDLSASCTSSIVVQDTTPPEITCPATIVAECQGNRHATVVPGDATATDICAGVVVTDPPSASFPLGSSFVTHSAEDAVGLTDSCNAEIKVVDTIAPVITCPAPVAREPDDLTCGVTFNGFPTVVSDVCDPTPVVTSSLPVTGSTPGPVTFDRIGDHTIAFTATDQSGNQTSCNWKVTVLPTSFCQKQESVDTLESLLAQDTGDKKLQYAIDHLYVSVGEPAKYGTTVNSDPSIWGDPTHVDTCNDGWNGDDVFVHEEETCKKLDEYVKDASNASFGFGAQLEGVRKSLAAADRRLAEDAIADATAHGVKASLLSQATTAKNKGNTEAAEGGAAICNLAIDYYADAWIKALKPWCPQPQ